jgi:hypothetical protein
LKNVKVPSGYSTNVSRHISLLDLKVASGMKSHDYHVLLTPIITVAIQNILPINVREVIMKFCFFFLLVHIREVIMKFCFFFTVIGQRVLCEEALESLEKAL